MRLMPPSYWLLTAACHGAWLQPGMVAGEEQTVLAAERLRVHRGSAVTDAAGELVFTFNNEFSWLTNKQVTLTMGQWPSKLRDAGAAGGGGAAGGADGGVSIGTINKQTKTSSAVELLKAAKKKAAEKTPGVGGAGKKIARAGVTEPSNEDAEATGLLAAGAGDDDSDEDGDRSPVYR